jgi:hypothetical protein
MPEKVRASPAGTTGYPQGRQAALDLLLPDPDEEEPPDDDPLPDDDPPEDPLPDDEEDEEPESEDEDELPADDPAEAPDSLLAATVPAEEERLSVR